MEEAYFVEDRDRIWMESFQRDIQRRKVGGESACCVYAQGNAQAESGFSK